MMCEGASEHYYKIELFFERRFIKKKKTEKGFHSQKAACYKWQNKLIENVIALTQKFN